MTKSKTKKGTSAEMVLVVFGLLLSGVLGTEGDRVVTTCSDGIDNDADGNIDSADAECDETNDNYDGDEDTDDSSFIPPPPQ